MLRTLALVFAVVGTGAVAGSLPVPGARTPANQAVLEPVWAEAKWPFALDQWGVGRAFVCAPADCGTRIEIYVRPKIGFCNCATGVADDEELDRVGDVDLVGGESSALGPGRPIGVQWMTGRSRGYALSGPVASAKSALSIALNDRCDVIVATIAVASEEPATQEGAALEFLSSDLVLRWAETTLGL